MKKELNNKKNKSEKLKMCLIIVSIMIIFIIGILFYLDYTGEIEILDNNTERNSKAQKEWLNSEDENTPSKKEKEKDNKKELTEYEKTLLIISDLIDEGLAYDSGDYVKGDITLGEYAFIKFAGSGSYYGEEDIAGNIVDNENFDSFGYVKVLGVGNLETRGVLISISSFERLNVSSAKQIYEILNNQTNYNQGGYYKVGTDIEPGTYTIESIGRSGYWAIKDGPIGDSEIVDNDNLSGKANVTLREGQYIEISRSSITKN